MFCEYDVEVRRVRGAADFQGRNDGPKVLVEDHEADAGIRVCPILVGDIVALRLGDGVLEIQHWVQFQSHYV